MKEHKKNFKLSIIVPVFNEENTITELIQEIRKTPYSKEIIVVDDYSSDGTFDKLSRISAPDLFVFRHDKNQGKGSAVRTGLAHSTGDILLIQDADLEYDPSEYPILLQPILGGKADVVYGSRFSGHGAHRVLYFWHAVGNKFLTTLSNLFTNLNLTDMETCYKVFTQEAISGITLYEKRFGFEPEITARFAQKKLRIYEVPISYHGRTYEEGKKINWKDGITSLICILKYNLIKRM